LQAQFEARITEQKCIFIYLLNGNPVNWAETYGITFPIVRDTNYNIRALYDFGNYIPSWAVIGCDVDQTILYCRNGTNGNHTQAVNTLDNHISGGNCSGVPDMQISLADIGFDPINADPGDTITIDVRVHNVGPADLTNGTLEASYTGFKGAIGSVAIPAIPSGGYADLEIDWDTTGMAAGTYPITISATAPTPNELIRSNNTVNTDYSFDMDTVPMYRFFNTNTGAHLYTISQVERDYILNNLPHYNYEGVKFYVYPTQFTDTVPAYRFFNTQTGAHLYTISDTERDYIINNLPHYNYEGPKFYVYRNEEANSTAAYRFFNTQTGAHLYTISDVERDYILNNLPHYNYEGPKFYVHKDPQ